MEGCRAGGYRNMPSIIMRAENENAVLQSNNVHNTGRTSFLPQTNRLQTFSQLVAVATLALIDLAILSIAISLSFIIRLNVLPAIIPIFPQEVPTALLDWLWLLLGISFLCLAYGGLYTKRLAFWVETKQLVKAVTLAFLLMLAIVSLGRLSGEVSRTVLVVGYFMSIILLPLGRFIGKMILQRVGVGVQPVLILGVGKTGELVARSLMRDKYLGYRIVGFLDDAVKRTRDMRVNGTSFPILGGFRDSDKIMAATGVRHLIVATPGMQSHELVGLVNRLQRRAASVTVIPDLFGMPVMGVEADYSFDEQMLSFRILNNLASPLNKFAKRVFDLVAGTIILIVALPIMLLIAVAVKLDSPGAAAFSHRRIGCGGKEFKCYKFRTMLVNAQEILDDLLNRDPALRKEWEQDFKLKNDPRVTRVGKFLRKTSLDELPQIFNVLKGEMSLVGPRPIVRKEVARFGRVADYYIMVRPGITGLWQVSGRSDIDYGERVSLESWYVRNWSLWLDISLLVRTIGVVLAKRGAY